MDKLRQAKIKNLSFAETSDKKLVEIFVGRARTYGTFGT